MPIYEYSCPSCGHRFELRRPFSEAGKAASCPQCHAPARKLLSLFTAFSKSGEGEATSISGMDACSTCTATSCASCNIAS